MANRLAWTIERADRTLRAYVVEPRQFDPATHTGQRIRKAWDAINRLGSGFSCTLTPEYLGAKVEELKLVHAYQLKVQAEKEEQRAIREQMRDEERAQKEIERAKREAEQEATRAQQALEKARREVEQAHGSRQQQLLEQVRQLEAQLAQANERTRSLSMAELTKTGHVYVISNVGSFGENVFKIGMTRRLDPQDRVDELGDASVPFRFDVHAMIYSSNAPALEKALHDLFEGRRVNRVNPRKEFFRVTLDEIEQVVRAHHGEFRLTRYAEAIEFRQSLALEQGRQAPAGQVTAHVA